MGYVFDLRVMVISTVSGYQPLALYARRAPKPLGDVSPGESSWEQLGTNLSTRLPNGRFSTDEARLIDLSTDSFDRLDLNEDALIESFVQTVLSAVAIDKMAKQLQPTMDVQFDVELFSSLN